MVELPIGCQIENKIDSKMYSDLNLNSHFLAHSKLAKTTIY